MKLDKAINDNPISDSLESVTKCMSHSDVLAMVARSISPCSDIVANAGQSGIDLKNHDSRISLFDLMKMLDSGIIRVTKDNRAVLNKTFTGRAA